ncbi:MAG: hypothetical protein ACLQU3_19100 [Limisphaerales bacterium]
MCLQVSSVLPWHDWNWSGDEIIHKPVIPACRPIPRTGQRYPIDIREYLTTANNAVVSDRLTGLVKASPPAEQALFRSHSRGSFDFRTDKIAQFFGTLRYLKSYNKTRYCPDAWLYPDETLAQGGGDCEDLAFLLAALLMAAGVSNYCIRVALGSLLIHVPRGKARKHDHCWVMYQNESGVWEIIEPTVLVDRKALASTGQDAPVESYATEYVPHYVFNADHLWLIRSAHVDPNKRFDEYCASRRDFWNKFNPGFAAAVHDTIFDAALGGRVSSDAMAAIKRKSLLLDADIATYDPRDHFDDGYVAASWERVGQNLAKFNADNTDWDSFGAAGHAIGDLYAHSSYVHFAQLQNAAGADGQAPLYTPDVALVGTPAYTATPAHPSLPPFDLTSGKFSTNYNLCPGTGQDAANQWAGQLISGRYAQKYDPKAGFWEGLTSIPFSLSSAPDYKVRGLLPHHNEIAIDSATPFPEHQLYSTAPNPAPDDRSAYANQFRWRVNTAIAHIRQAFDANWHGSQP